MDPRTLVVLERLGLLVLGSLTVTQESTAVAALHDAWVFGEIAGFPGDEEQLALAQRHVLRMSEIEARATS
jgi:hypothetical protein